MENKILREGFLLVVGLALFLAGCGQNPGEGVSPAKLEPNNSAFARSENETASYTRKTDPLSTLQAYNAALTLKDVDRAAQLLADDVVVVDQRMSPCIHDVLTGWHSVEAFLRNPTVLSQVARDYRVEGNRVHFTLTEWLDPRIVGPNYLQPRTSHVIAVTEYGLIYSLIMMQDSEWAAKDNDRVGAGISPCGADTHDS